jgi:hypothetical protein
LQEKALEDKGRIASTKVPCVEKQLAIAYSIKGVCVYELDPCSQVSPSDGFLCDFELLLL